MMSWFNQALMACFFEEDDGLLPAMKETSFRIEATKEKLVA